MRERHCRWTGQRQDRLLRLRTLRFSGDRGRTPWSWPIEPRARDDRPIGLLTLPDLHSQSSSLAPRRLAWIPDRIISSSSGERAVHHRHGLSHSSFYNWKRRLGEAVNGEQREAGFIELAVEPREAMQWEVELTLSPGVVLRVRRR